MPRQTSLKTPLPETELWLRQFTYTEELGRPFRLDVELLSPDAQLVFEKMVSERATIGLSLGDSGTRYFNGVVSEFWQTDPVGRFAAYRATVVPWLWLLTRTADCRIFQKKSIPDILKAVFQEYGFAEFKDELKGQYAAREYCVQYHETDFNFVSRLMEQEGIYYYWRHSANRHELVLVDDSTAHRSFPGYGELPFRAQHEGSSTAEFVSSWTVRQQVQPAIVALTDFNPDKPAASLLAKASITRRHSGPPWEIFDYPGEYEAKADGDRYAQVRIQELHAQYEVASGRSDARGISAGHQFTLERHPRDDQNRKYLITACEYSVREESHEAGVEGGVDVECSFRAIAAREQFRSERTTPRPVIQGPQTAMVVGQNGKKIDVDPEGRVKVQFHWDRYGKRDANSSCWIRVSQPWAGSGYGGMIIPRIGHEVIVEFLEGDPDRPIITGRVYNGDAKPDSSNAGRDGKPGNSAPKDIVGADVMTGFKSESLGGGGGNEITMNDTAGAEGLFFHALKDEIHNVGNDREDTVGHDETRSVGNDRSREVGNNETVKIGANKSITVGGNHTENIAKNMALTVAMNKAETVGIASAETVGAAKALTVGAAYQVSVGGLMNESVGAAKMVEVALSSSETVGKTSSLKAKKITVTAEDEIAIKVGSAQMTMKKNGDITIKGNNIKIKGTKIEEN